MIRIGSVVLRVTDLAREKAFWMAAIDYVDREGDDRATGSASSPGTADG